MEKLNRRLPVQIALVALVIYGITLSHGVTINSLPLTAKVAGWDWVPMAGQPLLWLLTLPLRLLPTAAIPGGLNLFSAGLAALTLGLLARSVQLMPWARPLEKQRPRAAAIPVFLACALCGLEFSFWQEAIAATGEMLDLLLVATVLWLLLEYRRRRQNQWLQAAALVWGLGMTETLLMLLAFPLFVAGVIWVRGIFFFRLDFLRRMAGWGLAGLSFYALLPLINGLSPHSPWSLGQAWLASLKQTWGVIRLLYYQYSQAHWLMAIAVALFYLVPTSACLLRWREEDAGNRFGVDRFQVWIFRVFRILLLLACLYLAFDPLMGLRQILQRQLNVSMPLLTLDYLTALGAAFLAGNFLSLSQVQVEKRYKPLPGRIDWWRLADKLRRWALPAGTAVLILASAVLVARNSPALLHFNFYPLEGFGELAVSSLPTGSRGVMLSDQPQKLAVFQAALGRHHRDRDWQAVDLRALPVVEYRAWLERRQPIGWLTDETRHELDRMETVGLLALLARTNDLFYLQRGYGDMFERFYAEPIGSVYRLKLRGRNFLEIPPLSGAEAEATETFWNRSWEKELAPLAAAAPSREPTPWQKKIQQLGFTPPPFFQDRLLAGWYSLALDSWGVELQQIGRWPEARQRFEQALQLTTNNFSARISLACNTNLQSGHKLSLAGVDQLAAQFPDFRHLKAVLNSCGPFDDPMLCYLLGHAFQQNGQWLQAVQHYERTRTLAPGVPLPEFALAELYTQLHLSERAWPLIKNLRQEIKNPPPNKSIDFQLTMLEADCWLAQTNPAKVRAALQGVLERHPGDAELANQVIAAYINLGDLTNAQRLVETQLAKQPDDVTSLRSQALILFQAGKIPATIPILDHILSLTNMPMVRFNRAIAQFDCQNWAAAETDYRELEKSGDYLDSVSYGLALIAEHHHDSNQVAYYLRLCLSNTPPGRPLWHQASARMQELERGQPFATAITNQP